MLGLIRFWAAPPRRPSFPRRLITPSLPSPPQQGTSGDGWAAGLADTPCLWPGCRSTFARWRTKTLYHSQHPSTRRWAGSGPFELTRWFFQ